MIYIYILIMIYNVFCIIRIHIYIYIYISYVPSMGYVAYLPKMIGASFASIYVHEKAIPQLNMFHEYLNVNWNYFTSITSFKA